MAGTVFKAIAEGIYTKHLVSTPLPAPKDTVNSLIPLVKSGSLKNTEFVLKKLDQNYTFSGSNIDWIKSKSDSLSGGIILEDNASVKQGLVPNVIGMGARDAVYLLENAGLRVNLTGEGKVKRQSIPAGSRIVKGGGITIELN